MHPTDYAAFQHATTARDFPSAYYVLGCVEEAGELAEARRAGANDTTNATLEAGDVLWYATGLLRSVGADLDTVLDGWATRASDATPAVGAPLSALGAMAAAVKKHVRGDADVDHEVLRTRIVAAVTALLAWVGPDLEAVAQANVAKLNVRRVARGARGGTAK